MVESHTREVVELLFEYRREHPLTTATFTRNEEVNAFNIENPFAFLLGAAIDRGFLAENAWSTPLWMYWELGHLEPAQLAEMHIDEIERVLRSLPKQPRYPRQAARTIKDCATQVTERWGGDTSRFWSTKDVRDIDARLRSIYGVGPGIAAMIVNILISDVVLQLPPEELRRIDVKPDVQVVRVFYRTGLAEIETDHSAINGARSAHPAYPGKLDQPAWMIGREFCRPTAPRCLECPLEGPCEKRGVELHSAVRGQGVKGPTTVEFDECLREMFAFAEAQGKNELIVTAKELHKRVGGYPGKHHGIPTCCHAMRKLMTEGDSVLYKPPSGKGASLRIRYLLPRPSANSV